MCLIYTCIPVDREPTRINPWKSIQIWLWFMIYGNLLMKYTKNVVYEIDIHTIWMWRKLNKKKWLWMCHVTLFFSFFQKLFVQIDFNIRNARNNFNIQTKKNLRFFSWLLTHEKCVYNINELNLLITFIVLLSTKIGLAFLTNHFHIVSFITSVWYVLCVWCTQQMQNHLN